EVGPLVLERRLLEYQMAFLHRRPQDHMAPDAGQRRLGPRLERRHVDHEVLLGACPAREPPAGMQLVGRERARVHGADGHISGHDPDLALLACAVAATGRVNRDPVPARSVEDRCAAGDPHLVALGQESQPDSGGSIVLAGLQFALEREPLGRRRTHARAASVITAPLAAASRARCAPIQLAPHGSWPSSRSDARTDCTHTSAVDMIALVSPAAIAIGRKPAFRTWRCGRPKETFDAPRHMLTPSSARIREIVASVVVTASVSAPTVIASGSMITSSVAIPWSLAALTILRAPSRRFCGVSGMPVSSLARPITAAPWRATSRRISSRRSSSAVTELTNARPS